MPQRNGEGPPPDAKGPQDGRGQGKGNKAKKTKKGTGAKTGGNKGKC